MEYEDELERMRDRRRRQRARQQQSLDSSRSRQESGRDLRSQSHDSRDSRGRRHTGNYDGRYYDDDYEYERRRGRGSRSEYDERSSYRGDYDDYDYDYDEYDSRDGYDDYGEYGQSYDGRDDYDDGYDDDEPGSGRRRRQGREGRSSGSGRKSGGQKQAGGKKKRRFPVFKILLLLVILAGGYFVYKYKYTGTGYWTVAVFGVDSRDGTLEKGALSDVEMLCVIDRGTGDIKLVSVYRDTYLEINPEGTYHKINEAYFKGGHEQAVEALERNLDLSIDDYATFNWKAVVDAINILGGIDLEISDSEFKYINSFITETVESTGVGSYQLEHAGMNHLDGIQAVAYARLRLMDTDYNRTARQRLVIQLAMNKAKEADLKTLTALVQTILPQISTSIGIDDLLPMVRNISKYHIGETNGFPFSRGETLIGRMDCVIPLTLESNVIQLHQILYGTENFQPSETVRQISAKIASDSGMGQVAENAPEAKVLGQRALEGSGAEDSGGSGSGSGDNSGGSSGSGNSAESSGNPAPPSQTEAAPAQTEAAAGDSSEALPESSFEESSAESDSYGEETQEETLGETQNESHGETDATVVQPSEEEEIGPGNPVQTEPESEPETTAAQAEPVPEPAAEETPAAGPGES